MYKMDVRIAIVDTDIFGRAHFTSFFRYIDMASGSFFETVGIDPARLRNMPVVEACCSYKAPVGLHDVLEVRATLVELREKSLKLLYRFYKKSDGFLVAEGYQILVAIDDKGRAVKIPDDVREILSKVMGK